MKTIKYSVFTDNTGDNSETENTAYVSALRAALAVEYQDAEIEVTLVDGCGTQSAKASGFHDDRQVEENCDEIANDIWGRADYL